MRALAVLVLASCVSVLAPAGRADDKPGKPAGEKKLPPGLAKKLAPAAESSAPAVLTLSEAIAVAEKQSKGKAIKAELKEQPEVHFKIELLDKDGQKVKVELTATGKPRTKPEDASPEKKAPEKPKPEKK
jgi:hypothetical protein